MTMRATKRHRNGAVIAPWRRSRRIREEVRGGAVMQAARSARVSVSNRIQNRPVVLFFAACTLFAVSACGTDSKGTPENKPKSTPKPTVSVDPQAAEKKQVLKVYRNMWEAKNRSFAKAELDPDVKKYASGKALGDIKVATLYYEGRGHVMKGEPVLNPEVTALDTDSKPAKATIDDCVDSSHYDEVDKKTGKKVDFGDSPRRHPNTTTLRTIGDKWYVWETSVDRERSC